MNADKRQNLITNVAKETNGTNVGARRDVPEEIYPRRQEIVGTTDGQGEYGERQKSRNENLKPPITITRIGKVISSTLDIGHETRDIFHPPRGTSRRKTTRLFIRRWPQISRII
jgi:hypothetical protein